MSRKKKTKAWLARHQRDPFVRRARQEGKRSRAAFKLTEMLRRFAIPIKAGDVAIDLGAAPGAWSAELARRVGAKGLVIAIDRLPMQPIAGVRCLQGDFTDPALQAKIEDCLAGRKARLVVCDAAPDLSGIRLVDQQRAHALALAALQLACRYLAPGGAFIVKTFRGEEWEALRDEIGAHFAKLHTSKPAASRAQSAEIYLVGLGFRLADLRSTDQGSE